MSGLGAGVHPPIFVISDDDHGGFTAVSVYTLLILSVFVVATRLSARFYIGRVVQLDDYLLAGATVSYVQYPDGNIPDRDSDSWFCPKCVCPARYQPWPGQETRHCFHTRSRPVPKSRPFLHLFWVLFFCSRN